MHESFQIKIQCRKRGRSKNLLVFRNWSYNIYTTVSSQLFHEIRRQCKYEFTLLKEENIYPLYERDFYKKN